VLAEVVQPEEEEEEDEDEPMRFVAAVGGCFDLLSGIL
jgi:hypothetical protein